MRLVAGVGGHFYELEDQMAEWANMSGFLVALGGVCLQKKSHA